MFKRVLVMLLPGLLCLASPAWAQDQQATQAQLDRLKQEVAQVQRRIADQERQRQDEQQALAQAEREIGRVTAELRTLDHELVQLDTDMQGLQSQREALETALVERRGLIEQLIQEQYRQGRQPRLQLLLKQEDPERLDRMLRYYDYLNAELTEQLQAYQQQLDSLGTTRAQIGSTEQQIADRRSQLETEQQHLQKARADRQAAVAQLATAQQQEQQRLAALRRDQEAMEALLADIQRSLEAARLAQDRQDFARLKGALPWPLQGRILRSYGHQRSGVAFEGLLIAGQAGAEVKAVHHGRVVFSDWLRGYGLVLILDHGSGYMSLYGHNQTLLFEPGDWVTTGQAIATAGNSGGHEETGLYFSIRHQGTPVNPSQWLKQP
ncbi:murein hydrolase activator EnvC family protein [Nitrincola sp.]|uniref:murein hydrolase activator EnvC family protein n=1 Tax=Nitrincola sp. TaxID=1926584 RepID=UPI003A90211B